MSDSSCNDFSWGHLASTERYGRESGLEKYLLIEKGNKSYDKYTQAAHCMIYAKTNALSLDYYEIKAIVLMQMRFDGYLGFPGGLVDRGESPLEGLNRELREEINLKHGPVKESDYQFTHFNESQRLVLHFYALEVDKSVIKDIERDAIDAADHGDEGLGLVRVPLYTMGDKYRGFPCFLHNNFIGNAKLQLLETLKILNIVSEQYIEQALKGKPYLT